MVTNTLTAFIDVDAQSAGFFQKTRPARGFYKVAQSVRKDVRFEHRLVPEVMTVNRAFNEGHLTEDDLEGRKPHDVVTVQVPKKRKVIEDHVETKIVDLQSKMAKVVTKPEEIISALAQHPMLLSDDQREEVKRRIDERSDRQVPDTMPTALVFLKNINGEAQAKETFMVKHWSLAGPIVENGQIIEMSPEIYKQGVVRDTVMYLPAFVEVC